MLKRSINWHYISGPTIVTHQHNSSLMIVSLPTVDFVLRDPREKDEEKKEALPPHREELAVVPKPWERTYYQARNIAIDTLHVTNPCMLQVLQLWHTSFKSVHSCLMCVYRLLQPEKFRLC